MTRYLAIRLLMVVPTVLGVLTVSFFLLRSIPGDPALYILGDFATEEALTALRSDLGLDQPLPVQYARYIGRLLSGDFGTSVLTRQPALREVLAVLPASATLAAAGVGVAILIGIPAGIISAVRQDSWLDRMVMAVTLAGTSLPVFWLGLVAVLIFAYYLKIFPSIGAGDANNLGSQVRALVLPAAVLGFSVAAQIARLTRSAMLEIVRQEYMRVARAKGLAGSTVILRHGLRNALIPVLAVIGVTFGWALGNAILVEAVFSRPGLGTLIVKAIGARDYQVVQAAVMVIALATVMINVLLDVLYGLIDPRLRRA